MIKNLIKRKQSLSLHSSYNHLLWLEREKGLNKQNETVHIWYKRESDMLSIIKTKTNEVFYERKKREFPETYLLEFPQGRSTDVTCNGLEVSILS